MEKTMMELCEPLPPPAPTGRWGILLPGPDEQCCLVTNPNLGGGHQSTAQLVMAPARGSGRRCIVRKMRKDQYLYQRVNRADREVRICREIERRISMDPHRVRPNIIRLIEALDIPVDQNRHEWRRTSYWQWYNMGSAIDLRNAYTAQGTIPPPYILARFLRQGLEVIDWLLRPDRYGVSGVRPIFHNDMHAGNIMVNWADAVDGPHFYVGDFGFARFQGEERAKRYEEIAVLSDYTRRMMTSPRDTEDSPAPDTPLDDLGNPAREEWDVHAFYGSYRTTEDSLMAAYNPQLSGLGCAIMPKELQTVMNMLQVLNDQDTANTEGDPSAWAGYQDLQPVIGLLRQYENAQKAAHDGGATPAANNAAHVKNYNDQQAMWTSHQRTIRIAQETLLEGHETEGWRAASAAGLAWPFQVVNINDTAATQMTIEIMNNFVSQPRPNVPPVTPPNQVGRLGLGIMFDQSPPRQWGAGQAQRLGPTSSPRQIWQQPLPDPFNGYSPRQGPWLRRNPDLPDPFTSPPGQAGQWIPPDSPTPMQQWVGNNQYGPLQPGGPPPPWWFVG